MRQVKRSGHNQPMYCLLLELWMWRERGCPEGCLLLLSQMAAVVFLTSMAMVVVMVPPEADR